MLLANFMIRANYGALEERPYTFNGIGVNVATYPFILKMIDPRRRIRVKYIITERRIQMAMALEKP